MKQRTAIILLLIACAIVMILAGKQIMDNSEFAKTLGYESTGPDQ